MAVEVRIVRLLLWLIIAIGLTGSLTQAQEPVESKAAAVRESVEQSPLPADVRLVKLPLYNSCHTIAAVGASQDRLMLLCREGKNSLVHHRHEFESPLSILEVDKNSLKFRHLSPVVFYQCPAEEQAFLQGQSLTAKSYGKACYFWNNLTDVARADRPVLQANPSGATCQPGHTVLQSLFEGETCAVPAKGTIRIFNVLTSALVRELTIDEWTDDMQLLKYTSSALVIAVPRKDAADEPPQPADAQHDTAPAPVKLDTGCLYAKLYCVDMPGKTFREIHPLLADAGVRFSAATPSPKGLLWWEYYPSAKQPNGIWILRRQEQGHDPVIITAVRNVDHLYYQWNGTEWARLIPTADPLLPVVGLAGNDDDAVIGILGELYLLKFVEDTPDVDGVVSRAALTSAP